MKKGLLLVIVSLLAAAFCWAEEPFRATVDPDGVQRVEVTGGSYYFKPSHIMLKVNVPVELKVRKEPGVVPHDIVMKEAEAGMEFSESLGTEPKVIRFTPKKTGVYPFFCSKNPPFMKSHRSKGMEGKMEIVE